MVEVTRKRPDAWWRDDFTVRFAVINGLPGLRHLARPRSDNSPE
jgi:hypothetical protein